MSHVPVMSEEVIRFLNPAIGKKIIDCTYGMGGHASALIQKGCCVLGIDQDENSLSGGRIVNNLTLINSNFKDIENIAKKYNFMGCDGVLFDLGISSFQLDDPERGFSFQNDGPLDMRMNRKQSLTAWEIINTYSKEAISSILSSNADVQKSDELSQTIINKRPINTTTELSNLIPNNQIKRKVFQALRIAVNAELLNLEIGMESAINVLGKNGRLVVISFHSLEDKLVMECAISSRKLNTITKKPILPSLHEQLMNPRSKSAMLRAFEKN